MNKLIDNDLKQHLKQHLILQFIMSSLNNYGQFVTNSGQLSK